MVKSIHECIKLQHKNELDMKKTSSGLIKRFQSFLNFNTNWMCIMLYLLNMIYIQCQANTVNYNTMY